MNDDAIITSLLEACRAALVRLIPTRISDEDVFDQLRAAVALAEAQR